MYLREKVKGYEDYEVDTNGIVYSKKGKPLKYSLNPRGYCIVIFSINGKAKGFAVHTLVAKQFIYNDNITKTQVNHKDGNKENNSVENLEWVTPVENVKHSIEVLGNNFSGKNNVNSKPVGAFDALGNMVYRFDSIADAGRFFCKKDRNPLAYKNSVWRTLKGLRKTYKGYSWKYIF